MEFYCQEFGFGKPVIDLVQNYSKATKKSAAKPINGWKAQMVVGGTPVGEGAGASKKCVERGDRWHGYTLIASTPCSRPQVRNHALLLGHRLPHREPRC